MNNLPSLKEFGKKLDLLKQLFADGKEEQASGIAQTVFENYVFARDEFLRQEAELLSVQDQFTQIQDHSDKLELKFKETLQSYNSDFQFFSKLCNALDHVNTLKDISDLPEILNDISRDLGVYKLSVVLDRDLCSGLIDEEIPTFYLKGCMRYIDATLNSNSNRVFIGPISKMMRPDIFFGDPDMSPEHGGSCFSFGMTNKYKPEKLIGLLSIYDPSVTRYHPEMGTDFLEHFCNSLASTLVDVINHQRAEILSQDVERITRHDLKTPLNAIINLPHVLLDGETDNSRVEMLKTIQDSGYKMLGLINRSYDIYRMESGTYVVKPEKVELLQLLKRISLELQNLFVFKQSQLKIYIDDKETQAGTFYTVQGEELLLFSMLANLIKNAVEATPPENPISVFLYDNEGIKICIHNEGAVPDSVKKSFFEKYSTAGKDAGTGLGTYSASLIAQAHNGNISMKSSPQKGTTVTINL